MATRDLTTAQPGDIAIIRGTFSRPNGSGLSGSRRPRSSPGRSHECLSEALTCPPGTPLTCGVGSHFVATVDGTPRVLSCPAGPC